MPWSCRVAIESLRTGVSGAIAMVTRTREGSARSMTMRSTSPTLMPLKRTSPPVPSPATESVNRTS
jgi:hypothetical protein